jgi:hypothetical protein
MRSLAELVKESCGEDANKEAKPEGRMNGFQPEPSSAPVTMSLPPSASGEASPRAIRVGNRQQETRNAADQSPAGFATYHADQDRQSDTGEKQESAARLEIAP